MQAEVILARNSTEHLLPNVQDSEQSAKGTKERSNITLLSFFAAEEVLSQFQMNGKSAATNLFCLAAPGCALSLSLLSLLPQAVLCQIQEKESLLQSTTGRRLRALHSREAPRLRHCTSIGCWRL